MKYNIQNQNIEYFKKYVIVQKIKPSFITILNQKNTDRNERTDRFDCRIFRNLRLDPFRRKDRHR